VTPNRGMGPPWGAFCQITLTSCFMYLTTCYMTALTTFTLRRLLASMLCTRQLGCTDEWGCLQLWKILEISWKFFSFRDL